MGSGVKQRPGIRRREFLRVGGVAAAAAALTGVLPRVRRAFAAEEPVRIGILGPLTDFTGRDIQRAAQIAADE
ncbi:MAG TPA: hypothetical protein VLM91_18530, partial [Candidatus Methylomirabilis sp.]|nr:hypothetical protein [Candidatus Methylomirabilis sp.]